MAGTDMALRKLVARCKDQEGVRQDMDARSLARDGREVRRGSRDGKGLRMQGALASMELLAQEDKYFEQQDVLDFMEITKGIGLSTRTALLKWASRAAHFKAQLPLGASGAVVGGFNLRFRFQKDVLRHFWSRVLETETETETDMHFVWLLACRCAHVEQPSVRTRPICILFGCLLADARTLNNHLCAQAVLSNV